MHFVTSTQDDPNPFPILMGKVAGGTCFDIFRGLAWQTPCYQWDHPEEPGCQLCSPFRNAILPIFESIHILLTWTVVARFACPIQAVD